MSGYGSTGDDWALDLAIVSVLAVVTAGILLAPWRLTAVAWIVGVPFLLFLPGYAVVSALFPEQSAERRPRYVHAPVSTAPDWTVRIALSFGLSAVVVSVVGVALSRVATIRLVPVVVTIAAVTLVAVAIAAVRRLQLSPGRRANPVSGRTFRVGTSRQTGAFVLALVLLLGTVAAVGVVQPEGEAYTESYLLTEGENGDLVAEGYPTTFVAGEGHPLYVALENHEHESMSYEVVVLAQAVDSGGSVTSQRQVDRFSVDLDHTDRAVVERTIAPTTPGEGVRLRFLVYKGAAPSDVDAANAADADQTLQIWIDVVEGADA
ncbi:DUF1616 domain-containing protein [Halopenitus persicus]|uniref:DUF1616 domain-containing protein n=1 Tax=Halopenitus persicus TaxID=1048396 RepID=UPI000BBA439A|nr:DUF1616 domain-containing protein [Halopenitus persicus]